MKKIHLLTLLMCLLAAVALGENAEDITKVCRIEYNGSKTNWTKMADENLVSSWKSKKVKQHTLTVHLPESTEAGGVYLTFKAELPQNVVWKAEYQTADGTWKTGESGALTYLNTFIPVEGSCFRLIFESQKLFNFEIREIRVYSQGMIPETVQMWETPDEVEALVLLSGCGSWVVPETVWEEEYKVRTVVAVMAPPKAEKALELMEALWEQGIVNYPELGTFKTVTSQSAKAVEKSWKTNRMDKFVAAAYRKYNPLRVYAPAEDAPGAEGALGKSAARSITLAGKANWDEKSGVAYGLYIPKELYAFDGENFENTLSGDGEDPLAQLMKAELLKNQKLDFDGAQRPDPARVLPADLDEEGYLKEGTFVHADEKAGLWIYLTDEIQISMSRCSEPSIPLTWYEADVKMRGDASWENVFHKEGTQKAQRPHVIAQDNRLVFAVNTDNYNLRLDSKERTGVIIRNGELVFDAQGGTPKNAFPPMDAMMIDGEGSFSVYKSLAHTAQDYLDMGAEQVYSFGPYLVKDGVYRVLDVSFYKNRDPRIGIGMIEPGHYCVILVEGRLKGRSKGCDLFTLGQMLYLKGCSQAMNLDGGQSGVICFMGEQINKIGTYSGEGFATARPTTEMLAVGRYE